MNNKGFAVSTIIYAILLMASTVLMILITTMASTKNENDVLYSTIDDELSEMQLQAQQPGCPVNVRYIIVSDTPTSVKAFLTSGGNINGTIQTHPNNSGESQSLIDLGDTYQLKHIDITGYNGGYIMTYDETRLDPVYYHHRTEVFNNNLTGGNPTYLETPKFQC